MLVRHGVFLSSPSSNCGAPAPASELLLSARSVIAGNELQADGSVPLSKLDCKLMDSRRGNAPGADQASGSVPSRRLWLTSLDAAQSEEV